MVCESAIEPYSMWPVCGPVIQSWTNGYFRRYRDQVPPLWHHQSFEASRARTKAPRALIMRRERVWLYIPNMTPSTEFPCVPALADWSLASQSQNPDTGLFVSSNGKPLVRPYSWRGWRTRPWITRLSGTMLNPSMAARGVAAFMSSLAVIPASRSHSQACAKVKMIRGTCGQTSRALSTPSAPSGASLKMSKATSLWAPPTCSATYARWATRQKQACFQRSKPAPVTSGAGSSLWPTPTTSLYCCRVHLELSQDGLKFRSDPTQVGKQFGLGRVARTWTLLWMLVTASGTKPTGDFRFPFTRPLHISLVPGERYSTGDLTFNPNFSDWMMGWPISWTDQGLPVTEFAPWLQRMRGKLSKLPILEGD